MIHLILAVLVQANDSSSAVAQRPEVSDRPLFAAVGAPRVELGTDPMMSIASDTTTPKKKKVVIEYSDWYETRLTIHRYSSWACFRCLWGSM